MEPRHRLIPQDLAFSTFPTAAEAYFGNNTAKWRVPHSLTVPDLHRHVLWIVVSCDS